MCQRDGGGGCGRIEALRDRVLSLYAMEKRHRPVVIAQSKRDGDREGERDMPVVGAPTGGRQFAR